MMKSVLVFTLSAAAAIQSVSAKIQKSCTDEARSFLIIRDGLSEYKELNHAANKKATFLAHTDELKAAKSVVKKYGSRAVVWELKKGDLKEAKKYRKKSKKLRHYIKKLMKSYKSATGKELKLVMVPSGTSDRIVAAFERKKVTVIKAATKLSKVKKTRKFIKKARKASKKDSPLPGSIVSFTYGGKNNAKRLKKLRRALKLANAEKCFKVSKKANKEEEGSKGEEVDKSTSVKTEEQVEETSAPAAAEPVSAEQESPATATTESSAPAAATESAAPATATEPSAPAAATESAAPAAESTQNDSESESESESDSESSESSESDSEEEPAIVTPVAPSTSPEAPVVNETPAAAPEAPVVAEAPAAAATTENSEESA